VKLLLAVNHPELADDADVDVDADDVKGKGKEGDGNGDDDVDKKARRQKTPVSYMCDVGARNWWHWTPLHFASTLFSFSYPPFPAAPLVPLPHATYIM
jgi:hypothetical protein